MSNPRCSCRSRWIHLPVLVLSLLLCSACEAVGRIESPEVQGLPMEPSSAPEEEALPPSPPALPPTPAGLRSVAVWEGMFVEAWGREHMQTFLPWSNSRDSWDFYNLAYGLDANTAMYRATGKRAYLDRALLYVNNMVASARVSSSLPQSQFKDGYLGWTSSLSSPAGQEVPLYESYCWRYVTRMLRIIRETPDLYGSGNYRRQYDRLLAFTERNIFDKWFLRGANDFVYRNRTHMAAHWAFIAMDLSRMTTDPERKARYLEVFDNINHGMPNFPSSLRDKLAPNPDHPTAWFWNDKWDTNAQPGQDVAHANNVLAFIVEAHDAGMVWTDADIRRFVVTLNTVIWPSPRVYAEYVDGTGPGDGWFNDGLMKLGRYDVNLQRRLEQHRVGQNSQFFANGALNVRMLSEQAVQ
ncbi:hypothetical protein COCOR_03131 [Corallococcus coralloides DSM 2259]|uniref:Lipoprotein n=1 Tax=Corallococcus coralloides (strain ATCC 25202 / DSM 2259 / NBRC 100086 / M2) TaxID=1144275 RepID=H8MF27_CORCM|nr:hypothetical protein COCOR_03131 [Corallococcus coralloides DSM 2259]